MNVPSTRAHDEAQTRGLLAGGTSTLDASDLDRPTARSTADSVVFEAKPPPRTPLL